MTADIVVYTTSWCPFCHRLRHDLDAAGIAYREVDVDHDEAAAALVTDINHGNRVVPTVVFADGSSLPAQVHPRDRRCRAQRHARAGRV